MNSIIFAYRVWLRLKADCSRGAFKHRIVVENSNWAYIPGVPVLTRREFGGGGPNALSR